MQACRSSSPYLLCAGDWQAAAAVAPRVGQRVCIDLPWSSHPFAVSVFRIDSAAQLAAVQALDAACVHGAPADRDGEWNDEAAVAALPSRHARQVLAELEQLCTGAAAPAAAGAVDAAWADTRLDPARCRRQLVEAAGEAAALGALLAVADQGGDRSAASPGSPPDGGLPPAAGSRAIADAVQAASRLADALSTKLTGLPSAYIRALCEDAVQPDPQRAFPRALHVAVLALLLARSVELDAAARRDLLLGALLYDAGRPAAVAQGARLHADPTAHLMADPAAEAVDWARRAGLSDGVLRVLARQHKPAQGRGWARRPALPSQIVALVDHYDRLCRPPPPAAGLAPHLALARLLAGVRSPADPPLLRAFARLMGIYPPGSLVRLSDEGYARVVGSHRLRPLRQALHGQGEQPGVDAGRLPLFDGAAAPRVRRLSTIGPLALTLQPPRHEGPAVSLFAFAPAAVPSP